MGHPTIFRIFLVSSLGSPAFVHAQAPTQDLRRDCKCRVREYIFKDAVLNYAVPASAYVGRAIALFRPAACRVLRP